MQIRLAELKDLKQILDIYNYEVLNTTATFDQNEISYETRLKWFNEHDEKKRPILVMKENDAVLGYASLSYFRRLDAYEKTAELSLYVKKEYRGQGIGKSLANAIINKAKENGYLHTIVSVITSGNDSSLKLHQDLGFTYSGTIKDCGEKFNKKLSIDFYYMNF